MRDKDYASIATSKLQRKEAMEEEARAEHCIEVKDVMRVVT